MLRIFIASACKKDIKRLTLQNKDFELFDEVLMYLTAKRKPPQKYRPHKLSGKFNGYYELHVQPDWLLLYKINDEILTLARTGSHSEIFT